MSDEIQGGSDRLKQLESGMLEKKHPAFLFVYCASVPHCIFAQDPRIRLE